MAQSALIQLAQFTDLTKKAIARAAVRSLNRAAVSLRAETSRAIRAKLKVKSADAKEQIDVIQANISDSLLDMKAAIVVKRTPVPLFAFGSQKRTVRAYAGKKVVPIFDKATGQIVFRAIDGRRQQVSVQVKDARKVVTGGFIAKMASGKVGIFRRTGGDRLPIKQGFSSTFADVFLNADVMAGLKAFGQDAFRTNFASQLAYEREKTIKAKS